MTSRSEDKHFPALLRDNAKVDALCLHTRLQMHMLRSRSECVPALLNFMQTLRKRVNESVDITPLVKRLKAERDTLSAEEKQELWKQIMVSGAWTLGHPPPCVEWVLGWSSEAGMLGRCQASRGSSWPTTASTCSTLC